MNANAFETSQDFNKTNSGADWSSLEELNNNEAFDEEKILSDYARDILIEYVKPKDDNSGISPINDETLSKLVEMSNNPEQAERIKKAIISGVAEAFPDEEVEDDDIDMPFEWGIGIMLRKAIENSETDSPEQYVESTKKLAENLGYQIPIQATETNLDLFGSYKDAKDIIMCAALHHAGIIGSDFRRAVLKNSIGYSDAPTVFSNPTDELCDYWERQSIVFGGNILKEFINQENYKREEDASFFNEDGTIADAAFSEDSRIMQAAFKDCNVGFFRLARENKDKITNSKELFFIEAAKDLDDPEQISDVLALSSQVMYGNFFKENGQPEDSFWRYAINNRNGNCAKLFDGYENHYSETDLAFLELPEEKREAILAFVNDLQSHGGYNEEWSKLGETLGFVEKGGVLSERFFENNTLGNINAEKTIVLFKEQALNRLKSNEISYCELPEEYRKTLISAYNYYLQNELEDGEEAKPYRDFVSEWVNEDGEPTDKLFSAIFDEGRFDLLVHEPLVPVEETGLSETDQKILEAYASIKDEVLEKEYSDFVIENRKNNYSIPTERLMIAPQVLRRLVESNADEIRTHRASIARQLLRVDLNDDDAMFSKLNEIEEVFIQNELPMAGKVWSVFSILHKTENLEEDFDFNSVYNKTKLSPALFESARTNETAKLIYRDLIKSYLGSSTQAAKNIDVLNTYFPGLDTGFESAQEALDYSREIIAEAHNRNIEAGRHNLKLEKGDLVKGIGDIEYLGTILENGSNAREFLGEGADSDSTPLDTDLSMVFDDTEMIKEGIGNLECKSYGPLFFVLKGKRDGEERFDITRRSPLEEGGQVDEVKLDSDKLEAFYTGALGKHHYGIRTGFASSEIDGIIVEKDNKELRSRVGLEIAMNGFYIPVYDMQGECIFAPEDYEEIRNRMSGLEYYEGINSIEPGAEYSSNSVYHFAEDLTVPGVDIDSLASLVSEAREETKERHGAIDAVFARAFSELGLRRKDYIDGNLTPGSIEVSDTGSTGRGTNIPHDGDYDYMFRIDRADFIDEKRVDTIRDTFLSALGKEVLDEDEVAYGKIIRLKHVDIPGIDDEIEVDITMDLKTNRTRYSTDESLRRRIAAMRLDDPEKTDQAIANIIFAKKFCKAVGAYKPDRAPNLQADEKGGLGGVGVENWILQNGGSFIEAAKDFINHARNEDGSIKSFSDFTKDYEIFDFGENHTAKRHEYQHDDFVSHNMNSGGYERLVKALIDLIDSNRFPDGLSIN